jgi:hypothetical protein
VVLGGVQASSGDAYDNSYCLGCDGAPKLTPNTPSLPSTVSNVVTAPTAGGTVLKSDTTPGPAAGTVTAATVAAKKPGGKRGGALAGVGLAGLAMIAAMAEGDRRKMRRAQREIPQFEE